ncbi:MAG TPA: hypothetical protein VEC06_09800 [Paucimonas sp.]|nr:hypothetical protein [Paucimonas sp.]
MEQIQLLINIQKDQTALIYTLWSFFQGLSLVLIGFVFTHEYVRKSRPILACLSTSLFIFSIGNHQAIVRAQNLVAAATKQLNEAAAANPGLQGVLQAFEAPSTSGLEAAHFLFTAFVVIGVWVPYLVSRLSERFGPANPAPGTAKR